MTSFAKKASDASRNEVTSQGECFRVLLDNVKEYAILLLDLEGRVTTWNSGAARIKGYRADEIIGQHFSRFYTEEEAADGKPERQLDAAIKLGHIEDEGWRVRKDGSQLWANVVITALHDENGRLQGFGKVVRDMTERRNYESTLRANNSALQVAVQDLDAFSYSVSHDLRAPLRAIDGFGRILLKSSALTSDPEASACLRSMCKNTVQMGRLIDDLLAFSRLGRLPLPARRGTS